MRRAFSAILAAAFFVAAAADGRNSGLTGSELKQVKRICSQLIGTQYGSRRWRQLEPYLRDPPAVEREVVCSASCGGAIPLRGGYAVWYVYPNPMKVGTGVPWGPRDAIVYSITVRKGDEVIFHRETEPKPPPFPPPWYKPR